MRQISKRVLERWWHSSVGYHGHVHMDNTTEHEPGELIHILNDFIRHQEETKHGVILITNDDVEYYLAFSDKKINGG